MPQAQQYLTPVFLLDETPSSRTIDGMVKSASRSPRRGSHSGPTPVRLGRITTTADVLCDGAARLGALSYLVPSGMHLAPGDAVRVPFGKRTASGFILGPGDPVKAKREILEYCGKRVTHADLEFARKIAHSQFCDLAAVAARLAPKTGKGAQPLSAGPVAIDPATARVHGLAAVDPTRQRRFLLRAPLVDPAALASREAARMAALGQVLILCPTVEMVEQVMDCFTSGAVRLDASAPRGAWRGFAEGTATVGVGTRAAALYSASKPAGIIVVEEDHPGHREQAQPHTHARDLAIERSLWFDTQLTLIGANPTAAGLGGKVKVAPVGSQQDWPNMILLERDHREDTSSVPSRLRSAVERALARGLSPVVVSDGSDPRWCCSRCGTVRDTGTDGTACTKCGGTATRRTGWDAPRIIAMFGKKVRPVTQAQLSSVRDAGVVVIADIDPWLRGTGLSPESAATHLVLLACLAAGRGGTVIATSAKLSKPPLEALFQTRDLTAIARRTWRRARAENLPPFSRLVTLSLGTQAKPRTTGWPGQVFGPTKRRGNWEILIRIQNEKLSDLAPVVAKLRRRGKTRVTVE